MSDLDLAKRLAADLRTYGEHRPECAAWGRLGRRGASRHPILPEACDCGLVPALERANALPSPASEDPIP